MISRRSLLLAASALLPGGAAAEDWEPEFRRRIAELERRHGGRLGVAVLDTGSGRHAAHRGEERFPLCSTFKLLAAAFVLARVDRNEESLSRRITYVKGNLVTYSPVTEKHLEEGLTIREICEAPLR